MRVLRSFLTCCMCFLVLESIAQQKYLDSLNRAYVNESDPIARIRLLYDIGNELALDNPVLQFDYADSLEAMALRENYKKGLAMAYHLRGYGYDDQGEYQQALEVFRKELQVFVDLKDTGGQSTALTNIGTVWSNMSRNDSAVIYYLKSMAIDERLGDSLGVSIHHNNVGNIYSDDGIYDKALDHFEKALAIRKAMGAEKRFAQCYSNMATTYGRMKQYDKALEYGQIALDYALKYDQTSLAAIIMNSIGSNLNDQGKYRDAIPWLEKAIASWDMLHNEPYKTYGYYNLSTAYAGLSEGKHALDAVQEGYAIVQKFDLKFQHELYFKAFAKAYEALGDPANAYAWYKRYVPIADSVFRQDNAQKVTALELQYETQKKEAQLVKQQLELEHQASQKRTILIVAVAILVMLAAVFFILRNRHKAAQREAELTSRLKESEAKRLRELDAAKSTFFANISHEFRTPLTLILGPLEQLMQGTLRGDEKTYFRTMHRNGTRLLNLVNQLLDLSKLESGKLSMRVAEHDLASVIRTIAGSFESLAESQKITFTIDIQRSSMPCWFDREKVEQIVTNLLSNAFKFTGTGGTISILVDGDPGHASIQVHDTGSGIPEEQIAHVFDRFGATGASELQAGSGIGLALARELAVLHGGNITVESRSGVGSVFMVSLRTGREFYQQGDLHTDDDHALIPAAMPLQHEHAIDTEIVAEISANGDVQMPLLLIAEDNADVRQYISGIMSESYRILEARNGREALQAAQEYTPDIIITDVMMPEMDGIVFCEALKSNEHTSHIPVVMLTARAEQGDRIRGLKTGADDYLVKPFDAEELLARVDNLVTQRNRLQEYYRSVLVAFTPSNVEADNMDTAFLRRVRDAIDVNLSNEDFSVVELASTMHMSRSQLHRKLSALTGSTPNALIRNMRLEFGRQLLGKNSGTISEIAFRCGFGSAAYFSKCFKEHFGVSPGEVL